MNNNNQIDLSNSIFLLHWQACFLICILSNEAFISYIRLKCVGSEHTRILAQASCVDSVPRRSLISMDPRYCKETGEVGVCDQCKMHHVAEEKGVNIHWLRRRRIQR